MDLDEFPHVPVSRADTDHRLRKYAQEGDIKLFARRSVVTTTGTVGNCSVVPRDKRFPTGHVRVMQLGNSLYKL